APAVVERGGPALGAAADVEDDVALDRLRAARVAVTRFDLRPGELLDPADPDGANVDDLDLGVEAVPVLSLVRRVEPLREPFHPRVVDLARGHVEAHLVALAGIAAVGEPADEAPLVGHPIGVELRDRLPAQLVEACHDAPAVERT